MREKPFHTHLPAAALTHGTCLFPRARPSRGTRTVARHCQDGIAFADTVLCVVAYTPLWWTGEEASWCLLQPKYARGNSTAVAASSQAAHRTAEAVLTSLRYSHSANSTTSLMSCTFDLWWQLYSSCLKLPHVAAVIRPREVPPASNLTHPMMSNCSQLDHW